MNQIPFKVPGISFEPQLSVDTAQVVSLKDDSRISYQNTRFENDDIIIKTKSSDPNYQNKNGGNVSIPISRKNSPQLFKENMGQSKNTILIADSKRNISKRNSSLHSSQNLEAPPRNF